MDSAPTDRDANPATAPWRARWDRWLQAITGQPAVA